MPAVSLSKHTRPAATQTATSADGVRQPAPGPARLGQSGDESCRCCQSPLRRRGLTKAGVMLSQSPRATLDAARATSSQGGPMTVAFPGESAEYRAARNRLLEQEIELRRATEAVAAARRQL